RSVTSQQVKVGSPASELLKYGDCSHALRAGRTRHFGQVLPRQDGIPIFKKFGSVVVFKGIHLLRDDVRVGADRAGKQLGFLEDRKADFLEVVRSEDCARGLFDAIPKRGLWRQDIADAPDRAEL